jgi:hypothetical protein
MTSTDCFKVCAEPNEFNPQLDVYPCVSRNCQNYHKIVDNDGDKLWKAIFYLQPDRVKNLLDLDSIDLLNFIPTDRKPFYKNREYNLLDDIFGYIMIGSGGKEPTLQSIGIHAFRSVVYPMRADVSEKACRIFEMVCQKYPHLISDNIIEGAGHYGATKLSNIFLRYRVDKDGDGDGCFICGSSSSYQLLSGDITELCKCKTSKIHLGCLINVVKTLGDICKTCGYSFRSKVDIRGRTFFPSAGIYASPLLSNYIILDKDDIDGRLHFATVYLVVDQVGEILFKMTDEQYLEYKKKSHSSLHTIGRCGELVLVRNPYSNMSFDRFPLEHSYINEMFEAREVLFLIGRLEAVE